MGLSMGNGLVELCCACKFGVISVWSTSTIPIPARLMCDGGFTAGILAIGGNSVPEARPGALGGLLGREDEAETCGNIGGGTGDTVALPTGCGEVAADSALTGGGRTLDS